MIDRRALLTAGVALAALGATPSPSNASAMPLDSNPLTIDLSQAARSPGA